MKTEIKALTASKKFFFLILSLLFGLFTFSCSDFVSGYVYEKTEAEARYVYITVEQENKGLAISSARTITPPTIDFTNSSENYYFYVWGKSSSGSVSPRKVDFSSSSAVTGTINLDFPVTTYTFVLAATTVEQDVLSSDSILKNAISVGFTNADLSYSTSIRFSLSTKGLSAFGSAYLNFYLDSTWSDEEVAVLLSDYNVRVGIYDNSANLLNGYSKILLYPLSKTSAIQSGSWYTSVPSGEFDLIISMSQKSGNNTTFTYSDKIIIEPNRTINSDVYIPNILDNVPAAPTNFKASWCMDYRIYSIYDSESEMTSPLTENSDLDNFDGYGLVLTWTDNSNNETGFKITLVDVSKISTDTILPATYIANVPTNINDSYWNNLVSGYQENSSVIKVYTPDSYYSANDYIAGSVERNSNSIIIYLPFGSCYIAKIESINASGTSTPCYATLNENFNVGIYDESMGANTAVYKGNAFSGNVINVYKIVYNLSGGMLSYIENNNEIKKFTYLVEHHSYGNGKILTPIAENTVSGTKTVPSLVYMELDQPAKSNIEEYNAWKTWFDSNLAWNKYARWKRWMIGAALGSVYIGTSEDNGSGFFYTKPNDYTGYTSLYLFARYD